MDDCGGRTRACRGSTHRDAITAFLKMDCARYREQVQDTLQMSRRAKRVVQAGGYRVEARPITAGCAAVLSRIQCAGNPAIFRPKYRSEERRVGKECRSRWSP